MKKLARWFLVFNVMATAACSEIDFVDGTGGKGGGGGTGGAGGSGGSTDSDGAPKPPAAQGALSIHLDQVDPTDPIYGNSVCTPGRHWVNVPYQRDREIDAQTQQISSTDAQVRAVNAQNGDLVSCRVAPRGTAFSVSAELTGRTEVDGRKLRPTIATISIPAISADQVDGIGVLTIQDETTLGEFTDEICVFSTHGGSLGVGAGSIWATVKCEYLEPRASPGKACRVDTGVFVLENCTQ